MNNAIGYIRISGKDQSNFSLGAQEEHVRGYADKNKYQLLALFTDNGQSAKNFDRAEWRNLEAFVKEHYRNIQWLIVPKYDRFSRNVSEALQMIELLEDKYKIRIISVFEPIHARPDSPYFFQFRTQMLMNAQVERLVIIERTRTGLNQAMKRGLVVNNAPYGYIKCRSERNEPTVKIDETKAVIIRKAFELFLQGTGYREIHLELRRSYGYKQSGKGCVQRLLSNPIYAGLVRVSAFMDEPAYVVKGIHEGLISPEIWWQVQSLMAPKTKTNQTLSEDFHMRGSVNCHCGRHLTAAFSKGKKIKVGYYFCHTHRSANLRSTILHDQFEQILTELSLPDQHLEYLRTITEAQMKQSLADAEVMLATKKLEYRDLALKQEALQEQFLNRDWSAADFHKWNTRLTAQKNILTREISELSHPLDRIWEAYRESIYRLGDMKSLFNSAFLTQKQAFIKILFDNQLYYQDGGYRTHFLIDIFKPKAASLHEKGLLIIEQPEGKIEKSDAGSLSATKIEHLNNFLSLVASIRVA